MQARRWQLGLLILSTTLSAVAVAAPEPLVRPGPVKVFKDWVVGCDNALSCEAVGLVPDSGEFDGTYELDVVRGPEANATPKFSVQLDERVKGAVAIEVDGNTLATLPVKDGVGSLQGAAALELVRALAQGKAMTIAQEKKILASPLLSGAAAALRYIDAQQNRADNVTALVARGKKPATALPSPPALPVVAAAKIAAGGAAETLAAADLRRARQLANCEAEDEGDGDSGDESLYRLDAERSLLLLPCGTGAYNFNSAVLLVQGRGSSRRISAAPFDDEADTSDSKGVRVLVNAEWDPQTATLTSYSKGRGIGDCGDSTIHAWDGSRFRLTEAAEMPECRGSQTMVVTWRANVQK